jgi:1,2-diacylglycerol 3-beta-glucosyltransferase
MVLEWLLCLAVLPVSAASAYLFLLTLYSGRLGVPLYADPRLRFAFVVPSHNEEAGIAATVENLLSVDYPKSLFSVVVVADNCEDETASRAQAAGARVLVRKSEEQRGKGYALLYAFTELAGDVDAVVVVDADTVASPNLLRAFSSRIEAGADAVQADYAVRNPDASWRTRLMAIAFGAFHILRSLARERLRVSCGLRGNGMCFTSRVLSEVRYDAFSVVEDVEYGIRLAKTGHRVVYAAEAHVYGEMVSTEHASRSQRARWERGRYALTRDHAFPLLAEGLRTQNRVLLDLAGDLLVPPLGTLAAVIVLGLVVSAAAFLAWGYFFGMLLWVANLAAIVLYVLRGWALSGTGARGLIELGCAPFYVAWKLWLRIRQPRGPSTWVRTAREPQAERPSPVPGAPPTH